MKYEPFRLERYFAEYEFSIGRQMSCSDCESVSLNTVFDLLDFDEKKEFMNMTLGYTESTGSIKLREEIAKLYTAYLPEEIFVAAPEECIYLTLNCLLEKGDRVIALYPAYQSLTEIPRGAGCETIRWYLRNTDGEWSLDLDFLEQKIAEGPVKAILVNFPHNPTGFVPSSEEYRKIIEIAEKNNIFIFSDEMYWLLEHDYREPLPPACTVTENSVSLFGMSKSFGLPGLRIGWIATKKKELYEKVSHIKDYTTICSSAPSEHIARIALRHRDFFIGRSRDIIRSNIDYAVGVFEDLEDILVWNEPLGSSVAFPSFGITASASEISRELIKEHDLLMLPGKLFDYDDAYFRLGLGRKNFKDSLYIFKKYLEAKFRK